MDALLDALARVFVDPRALQRSWLRRIALALPIVAGGVALGIFLGGRNDGEQEPVIVREEVQVPGETEKVMVPVDRPVPVEAKIEPEAKVSAKALTPPDVRKKDNGVTPPKKSDWCYAHEDDNSEIAVRTKTKQGFVRDKAGECWTCRPPPTSVQLSIPGCTRYRTCSKAQDPTKCAD